jgi:hypothetical protein
MIAKTFTRDARYPIGSGHGSDAIHKDPICSYAVTLLQDEQGCTGTGPDFPQPENMIMSNKQEALGILRRASQPSWKLPTRC